MYVRIIKRRLENDTALDFSLVESRREGSKVSQSFVAYLGNIRQSEVKDVAAQARFLKRVESRVLTLLGNQQWSEVVLAVRRRLEKECC
jgi:hypothetical protein